MHPSEVSPWIRDAEDTLNMTRRCFKHLLGNVFSCVPQYTSKINLCETDNGTRRSDRERENEAMYETLGNGHLKKRQWKMEENGKLKKNRR